MQKITDIGVLGLGAMGQNLALNFASKGLRVSVYNRTEANEGRVIADFIGQNKNQGNFLGFTDLETFVDSLAKPRKIFMMIKAGQALEEVIKGLFPFLNEGDVLIDGGNSHYIDTEKRVQKLKKHGIGFVGCGMSGGTYGALNGPCLMPGGEEASWSNVKDLLQSIAAKDEQGNLCCEWIGPGGSGHFVKMVHNGIEYSLMQIIAETYDFLLKVFLMSNQEVLSVFKKWNEGELGSYLIRITDEVLSLEEADGTPLIENVLDIVKQKGTGKDIAICALEHGVAVSTITEAVNARFISGMEKSRSKINYSKTAINEDNNLSKKDKEITLLSLVDSLYCANVISIIQGLKLIKKVSKDNSWNIDISNVLNIWSHGSIIQSKVLQDINIQSRRNSLDEILIQKVNQSRIKNLFQVVSLAAKNQVPFHVYPAALSYYLALSSAYLPANLIQLQREYFGSHGFVKKNSGGKLSHLEEDVK